MTNTKQFRLGNLINDFQEITFIKEGVVHVDCGDGVSCRVNEIEPIELTDEIMGYTLFDYDHGVDSWSLLHGNDNFDAVIEIEKYQDRDGYYYRGYQIKYLHNLQNLFHGITNQELKITKP